MVSVGDKMIRLKESELSYRFAGYKRYFVLFI